MSLRRSSWDMRAFFKAKGQRDGDEIAATAAWRLEEHLPKGTKLRLSGRKKAVPRESPRRSGLTSTTPRGWRLLMT